MSDKDGHLLDEKVMRFYGVPVVVCEEHHRMSKLYCDIEDSIEELVKAIDDPMAVTLANQMRAVLKTIDNYVPHKWPNELFGPKKEDKEGKK